VSYRAPDEVLSYSPQPCSSGCTPIVRLVMAFPLFLAACGQPFWTPRPALPGPGFVAPTSAADILSISIVHSGCLGWCPVYGFRFAVPDSAMYEGACRTPLLGLYVARDDSAAIRRVATALLEGGFFGRDSIVGAMIDGANVRVEATLSDGRTKSVLYGEGARVIARMEDLAGAMHWQAAGGSHRSRCAA
jgi:hypothetical protein